MYKKILLSIDLNDEASWVETLKTALGMCHTFGASLHLVHVIAAMPEAVIELYLPEDSSKKLAAKFAKMMDDLIKNNVPEDIKATPHLGKGNVYNGILEVAKEVDADLIIIGPHRPTMVDFLLGPNAARVVRHATCSVLVVRD